MSDRPDLRSRPELGQCTRDVPNPAPRPNAPFLVRCAQTAAAKVMVQTDGGQQVYTLCRRCIDVLSDACQRAGVTMSVVIPAHDAPRTRSDNGQAIH